jgi:hypothetical protein
LIRIHKLLNFLGVLLRLSLAGRWLVIVSLFSREFYMRKDVEELVSVNFSESFAVGLFLLLFDDFEHVFFGVYYVKIQDCILLLSGDGVHTLVLGDKVVVFLEVG